LIITNKIESVIKIPNRQNPGPDGFTGEVYQTFKEELILSFFKLSQKIEKKGMLPNSLCEASITLTSKSDR